HFRIVLPWWIELPSVLAFYGMGYELVDRSIWKWQLPRRVGLLKLPNLSGTWEGYVTSTFDSHADKHAATIEVRQTWTRIVVTLRTDHSESHSLAATLLVDQAFGPLLSYEYLNEPKPNALAAMQTHRGTARLRLESGNEMDVLDGEYYAGRGRENQGIMHFERRQGAT